MKKHNHKMKEIEQNFLELIDRHKRVIYKVCYMYTIGSDNISDLFQEVVVNLWKGFPSFRGESS